MNVLIVSQYYYPEPFRIHEIAEEMVKLGNSVTVLTGLPNYPTGVIPSKYRFFRNRKETINGVTVKRCFLFAKKSTKMSIVLNYISFMVSASIRALCLRSDFDAIYVYQLSPVLMAVPGILYKKKHHKKMFLYCLDVFPASIEMFVPKTSRFYKLIWNISNWIYKQCDSIGVTSESFISYFTEVNAVEKSKLHYIPQHANDELLFEDLSHSPEKQIHVLFAGNIGVEQNLEVLVDAVSIVKNNGISLVVDIVGSGSHENELKQYVRNKQIENQVIFHGRFPSNEMVGFYRNADLLFLSLSDEAFSGNTIPGKLQMYMTTGKPIVAAIGGAAAQMITESDCGKCVGSKDSNGLAQILMEYKEHPECFSHYGEKGRAYFLQHFTLEKHVSNTMKQLLFEDL